MIEGWLGTSEATERLGALLAVTRPAQSVVQLQGDLGAGKSTLARAMLRALGVRGTIRSPTYTLVERYQLDDGSEAWHLDLYRLGNASELDFLGLDEASASLWLVEWPERCVGALPPVDLTVRLAVHGDGRRWALQPENGSAGRDWIVRLMADPALRELISN